jgi:hypothetical protein
MTGTAIVLVLRGARLTALLSVTGRMLTGMLIAPRTDRVWLMRAVHAGHPHPVT